jgi:hypothetical protein
MFTKFVLAFAILALVAATAGTPAKGPTYHVTLTQSVVLHGTPLKAGDYKVTVTPGKVFFTDNKGSYEIPATVESAKAKYYDNQIQYDSSKPQVTIVEIGIGGTKTLLKFN